MTAERLRIALAQLNLLVGDVDGNTSRIVETARDAHTRLHADLVLFPELALSGYPPEDLLFHNSMRRKVARALERLRAEVPAPAIAFGFPEYVDAPEPAAADTPARGIIYNSAAFIADGELIATHRKHCLPNYKVFDEKRYFQAGRAPTVVHYRGMRLGLIVCEDAWAPEPARAAQAAGAELLLVVNASPYEIHKQVERETVVRARVMEAKIPVAYVNLVGGQDELVFDGHSFVMDAAGQVVQRALAFQEELVVAEFRRENGKIVPLGGPIAPLQSDEESVYGALVLGVRDYVNKHRFPGVVMGLSGGVDSALTLAIAVDALGADRVRAVMMPSRYTSKMSIEDATEQARAVGVTLATIPIEGLFGAALDALAQEFAGLSPDTTEENIQARCRGLLLMALSNKSGRMLLTTGNKSEMAVGYATLYGDMAGGFAPIKDCSKLLVYRLAHYRNELARRSGTAPAVIIPERVITRAPSAELRHDQKDSDALPPYEVLDPILEAFIEEDLSVDQIAARGFDRATVGRVLDMVKRNEYKRRQAPPGVRVSGRAFGRDWRYPITSGYRT